MILLEKRISSGRAPIRVLIADDCEPSRAGLRALLATTSSVEVVGEARDGLEAVRLAESCRPDVVLMDLRMPGLDGLEATRRIKAAHPETRVVILTLYACRRCDAATAGADAFLVKGCQAEGLFEAMIGHSPAKPGRARRGPATHRFAARCVCL